MTRDRQEATDNSAMLTIVPKTRYIEYSTSRVFTGTFNEPTDPSLPNGRGTHWEVIVS
jgi:hypothetical protein